MSRELAVFGTPWHWLVHGLGLGQTPDGFDAARAARVLSVSDRVNRRFASDTHRFIDELVRMIVSHCEAPLATAPSSLPDRLAGLRHPCDHARACALLIESLVKTGLLSPDDRALRAHWAAALERIAALPSASDAERYRNLHLLVSLLLAAGQAGWTIELSSPAAGYARRAAYELVGSIGQPFYRTRGAAILITVLGLLDQERIPRHDDKDLLAALIGLIDAEFQRFPSYPSDGVHVGRDFRLFPLLLTLTAIGVTGRFDCLRSHRDWLSQAGHEIGALTAASRASQSLFWVSALRSLGVLSSHMPDPAAFLAETVGGYLENTDGRRADDYLRCTYLIHLARQLGCPNLIPPQVWEILGDSVTRVIGSGPHRENPYASGFMIVAYALSAINAGPPDSAHDIDLAGAVFRIEDDPAALATQLPRLGFSLVDAALRLRKAQSGDTRLFEAVTPDHRRGDP